jgi:hypothetical protein
MLYLHIFLIQKKILTQGNKYFHVQFSKVAFIHRQIHIPCYTTWWVTWHSCIYICYWRISCILILVLLCTSAFIFSRSTNKNTCKTSWNGSVISSTNILSSIFIIILTPSTSCSNGIQQAYWAGSTNTVKNISEEIINWMFQCLH